MLTIWDLADPCGNLRVRDVAAAAGVNRQTVYKWVDYGLLPCRRLPISRRLMFSAQDVERFLTELAPTCDRGKSV